MKKTEVIFSSLKRKSQLKPIDGKKVISAGFTDDSEKEFQIVFDIGKGRRKDISIIFLTRYPRFYISKAYRSEQTELEEVREEADDRTRMGCDT